MKLFISILTLIGALSAHATTDSIGNVFVPYMPVEPELSFEELAEQWNDEDINVQMFCMASTLFWDTDTASKIVGFQFLSMPLNIPVVGSGTPDGETVNSNVLSDDKIQILTDWEKFENYVADNKGNDVWVQEPEFVIDVSNYDQSTDGGKLQALTMAKLAIISLHYNLSQYGDLFRLSVTVEGLPKDQSKFTAGGKFSPVYKKTQSPFSAPSPLAQKYYAELLSTGTCGDSTREKATSLAN